MSARAVERARQVLPFALILACLLGAGRSRMLDDPGTLWHTVVGRDVLATGLPRADRFSFTRAGEPWIAQQWLAEAAMAALDRIGGLDALLVAAAILLAALFASLYRRLREAGVAAPLAAFLVAASVAASASHFLARPHLVTLALSAWLYARLCDVDAGRAPPGRLLAVPPALFLWANLHGGALGGLATLALALAGWLAIGARGLGPCRDRRSALVALAVLALALVAPLGTPYGLRLLETWRYLLTSPVLPRAIIEHAPPPPGSAAFWALTALVALYLVGLAAAGRERLRITWLLPLAWAVLGYARLRHGAIFAVLAPIALSEMLPGSRLARWSAQRGSDLLAAAPPPPGGPRPWAVAVLALAAALAVQAAGLAVPLVGAGWARLDPTRWPTGLLPALRAEVAARPATDRRVFNDMRFGGFLIYFAPSARVFIDDRCELYRDHGIEQALSFRDRPELALAWLEANRVGLALVERGTRLDRTLAAAPRWVLRSEDPAARVYARPGAPEGADPHLRRGHEGNF